MTTYKNRLPLSALMGYIFPAPHKTGAGIGTPLTTKAHNRASGFFTCDASPHLFRIMAGRMGQPQGWPGSFVAGSSNPVRLATQSLEPLGGELSQLTTKGYPSWQTVNNASARAAIRSRASTPKPKSAAACTVQLASRKACISTCCTTKTASYILDIWPLFLVTCLTICTSYKSYKSLSTSQRTPRNAPPICPCWSGVFVYPVNREVWLWP
ncbi:TPA: ash family protein [Salmonella enterica subsp. enterica serovar Paratyphi B]|nr:ash family protein [Salmonella enterica subsp. enterica serovar Paratyphi B]